MNNEITITLTGDTATRYMQNESLHDSQHANVLEKLNKLQEEHKTLQENAKGIGEAYVVLRAQYEALVKPVKPTEPEPSIRVKEDTQKAKDLSVKDSPFEGKKKETSTLKEVEKPLVSGRWKQHDFDIIEFAINQPSKTNHRKIDTLVYKLGRSLDSVRTKLYHLGIDVRAGYIYKRK